MSILRRCYEKIIQNHLDTETQMIFLPGPRQVGKTTLSQFFLDRYSKHLYLNWDVEKERDMIMRNFGAIVDKLDLESADPKKRLVILDELHKFPTWQTWLKGLFDKYHTKLDIIVTGSSRLNVFRRGGDSMMGRYALYTIHPLSVAELIGKQNIDHELTAPLQIDTQKFDNLLNFGGFPYPFIRSESKSFNRWSKNRFDQLFREDLKDISDVREVVLIELLAKLLGEQVGKNTSHSSLARKVRTTDTTITRWLSALEVLYYCFTIRPWSKNVTRSLIKEPKYYLWDWSQVPDSGARKENLIASHLLKAVHYWTDIGLGTYELYYLRDKDKREVDFLVSKDGKPWFIVEVKTLSNRNLSPSLAYFQKMTGAQHAFQVAFDMPYISIDCFSYKEPVIVPVTTFLSQLV